MAIKTKIAVRKDNIKNELYASARIVDLQEMDFDAFCEYLAQDSTVGAADVAAVMKQLEKKLPLILGMGTKVQPLIFAEYWNIIKSNNIWQQKVITEYGRRSRGA